MVSYRRLSKYFPNPLTNQLAIVHRQGSDIAYGITAVTVLYWVIALVRTTRAGLVHLNFLKFSSTILIGFGIYLIFTLLLRYLFYFNIMRFQGISHPKFLITLLTIPLEFLIHNDIILMSIFVFCILSGIDVFMQNQMHDIVSTIGPNSWEITSAIPIFQIPFQRIIQVRTDELNQFDIRVYTYRHSKLPINATKLSGNDVQAFLDHNLDTKENKYYAIRVVQQERSILRMTSELEVFLTNSPDDLLELLYELHNLLKISFD